MVIRLARLILVLVLCAVAVPALADFTCDASVNRTSVSSGGEVVLTVSARGDVAWSPDFELPDLAGVRVYAGGTSQNMSMMNGKTETTVSRTYYLKVETDKNFTIGPITIRSAKQQCRTKSIAIKVSAAIPNSNQVPPTQTGNRVQRPAGSEPRAAGSGGQPGDEVFVTLEADVTEAWVGQQIVLTFRYWYRTQPWNNPTYSPPRTEGFWREDLGSERKYRKVVEGRAYTVQEIRYAIFPTRVGNLVIEPAELTFPSGVFDRFFRSNRTQRGPNTLRTDAVNLRVKGLPKPHALNYSGIVASQLKFISQVDRDTVPRGEAIGLKVLLRADGFLKGLERLEIPVPAETRMHDAGEGFRTSIENNRLVGTITMEKVIVPQQEGWLTIPPVELVWFDTKAGRYRTARTGDWPIAVTASDLPQAGDDDSGFLRSEIARLGDDLAFIHQVPGSLSRQAGPRTGGVLWWSLIFLPLMLLAAYRYYLMRHAAALRDPAGRLRRGALAAARLRLAGTQDDGMSTVARAICGYVADWHNRSLASVGPDEVRQHCTKLGAAEVGIRLCEILVTCDTARYGQSDPRSSADLAAETAELLAALHGRKSDRTAPSSSAGLLAALGMGLLLAVPVATAADAPSADAPSVDAPFARPGADPVRLLAEGNQAYTEGLLAAAEAKYLAARDLGVNDPVLHFNLGNTYARSGQLGEAVASYLRAQRLDPLNGDIQENLAWVRRHISDLELGAGDMPLFIGEFVALIRMLTLDQWGGVLVLLVWVVVALVAWGWYRDEITIGLRRALLGMLGILLVTCAITGGRWYVEQVRQTAVVVVPEAVVRSGPAENFPALFEVHDGLTLSIVGRREGWVRVGLGGDWEGWVPDSSVVLVVGHYGR